MNRMISLARIMFAGLGIYLSIAIFGGIIHPFMLVFDHTGPSALGTAFLSLLFSAVMLAAVVWGLFIKGDYWAHKLIARDLDSEGWNIEISLTMAFRLVCVGAGLICLRSFVFRMTGFVLQILTAIKFTAQTAGSNTIIYGGPKFKMIHFIQTGLLLALSIYLLWGAPHFVRWQVKKTKALCNQKSD